jgi:hypothetical protein
MDQALLWLPKRTHPPSKQRTTSSPIIYIIIQAGYREGITAGKEDALQEGFDAGFAQAGTPRGRELGLLRGLASAFLIHLSRSQAQVARARARPQPQQTQTQDQPEERDEEKAAAAALLLPAVREIVEALASVRFADIAPPPPAEEVEHVRAHAAEEGKKKSEEMEGEAEGEVAREPTGLTSSAGSKVTIEDVRALRVRLEALLCQVGLKVDRNFESLDP